VEVIENALVLSVMRFADELVDTEQFRFPAARNLRKPELDMAKMLVNSLSAEWQPEKYTDQYRENLMRIIKGKIKGREVALEPGEERRPAEVVDLMERLRKSLEATGGGGATRGRTRRPKPAKASSRGRKRSAA
jgi:DNA end-binding protein Ku